MKLKTKKILKSVYNNVVKVGVSVSGVASIAGGALTGNIPMAVTGVIAISSAVSAAFKDKKFAPIMKIVNILACNLDRATNNPVMNK
jgi:hypothetical protein